MNHQQLKRTYYLSDTFGGINDPFLAPDPDALISTDLRSRSTERIHREFDILGREEIHRHILRLICRLHDEIESCLKDDQKETAGITGVLINSAPRTETFRQAEPFYLAELIGGKIRIVCPLDCLRPVKDRIEHLHKLPNKDNGIFRNNEQFRSSFVGRLLENDYDIPLQEADPSKIRPDHAGWVVEYVDRFGNIVTRDNRCRAPSSEFDLVPTFRLRIGDIIHGVTVASDLNSAPPGEIAVYQNDGGVEVVRKWTSDRISLDILRRQSAYALFGEPQIGSPVVIAHRLPEENPFTEPAYELLNGQKISLSGISEEDRRYLAYLKSRILDGNLYTKLLPFVRGLGAYPLHGSVFRIVSDLVDRAGIDQGFLLPNNA